MVYVLNKDNEPLMPTDRHGKVRRLLKSGSAKVVKRCPFTIQLLYETDKVNRKEEKLFNRKESHIPPTTKVVGFL